MIKLPVPPSANKLFANVRRRPAEPGKKPVPGRIKTKVYKAWITAAGWELKIQRPPQHNMPVVIQIFLPESSGLDLDNCIKPTVDLLVRHQVIPDDRRKYVRRVAAEWIAGDKMMVGVASA